MNAADAPRTPMPPWLEQVWLMRYLDRQLDSDEEAWFEAYLLDRPHLVDQLEADTYLRDALAGHGLDTAEPASPAADPADAVTGERSGTSIAPVPGPSNRRDTTEHRETASRERHRRRHPPWLAMAASFAAGIGLAWLGLSTLPGDSTPGVIANPPRIVFDTLRGEYSAPHVEPGDPNSPFILVEILIPPGATDVQAIVPGYPPIALHPSVDGFATLVLPRESGAGSIELKYLGENARNSIRITTPPIATKQ